jgi:hypothetical protein
MGSGQFLNYSRKQRKPANNPATFNFPVTNDPSHHYGSWTEVNATERGTMKFSACTERISLRLDNRFSGRNETNHRAIITGSRLRGLALILAVLGLAGQLAVMVSHAQQPPQYFKLQLKHGGQFLDADHCGSPVTLNPGSTFENGACELWRLVPAGGGWSRLQLKHGGQYLDAAYCSSPIGLNPGSTFENGACQLWRFVPVGDGWNRLQLKHGGQYLDADHCTPKLALNSGSTFENGACQLWRIVREPQRID